MLPAAFLCSLQANIGLSAYALSNRLTGGISLLLRKIGISIPRFPDSFLPRLGTLAGKPSRRSHPAALSNASFTFAQSFSLTGLSSLAKNSCTNPHATRSFFDSNFEIMRHAHRENIHSG